MIDWKEKYKEHLTASGNLKRSLSTDIKTEIFQYRVSDKFEVLGQYGKNNDDPIDCRCKVCKLVTSVIPRMAVSGKAACKVCAGTPKRLIEGVPEHLVHAMPSHVAIRGITEPYRGVEWLNTDVLNRDIFFIVEHRARELYSFVTLSTKMFKSIEDAALFVNGVTRTSYPEAYDTYYTEVVDYLDTPQDLWRGWEHATMHNMWVTDLAPLVQYCLEKKYRKNRYYKGYDDGCAYLLNKDNLKELSELTDINSILNWEL